MLVFHPKCIQRDTSRDPTFSTAEQGMHGYGRGEILSKIELYIECHEYIS